MSITDMGFSKISSYLSLSEHYQNITWYVLFAANGKAAKFCDYLKAADIEYQRIKKLT